MRKVICEIHREKYSKNTHIYRGVGRSFTDAEVRNILNTIERLKFKVLFSLLAFCGFRISETVKLKLEDVNLQEGFIRVVTAKQKGIITDFAPIPENIYPLLELYLKKYGKRIQMRGGWLFPQKRHNNKPISEKVARDVFYVYRNTCNLTKTYAIANDENNPSQKKRGKRELHSLTLHSFRHWFKVRLDKGGVPYGMIRSLMRHQGGSVTDQYGQYSLEEKKKAVDEVFKDF